MFNMFKFNFSFILLVAGMMFFTACSKDEKDSEPIDATETSIFVSSNFMNPGPPVLFSFETGATVESSEFATTNWDFGMVLISILVNGGPAAVGDAGVQILNGVFDEILEAPEDGYLQDQSPANPAIATEEWGVYNPQARSFSPIAGKVFVFRTAKGNYAKMEFTKVDPVDDNGNVVVPPVVPTQFKYSLRYVHQADGSRSFAK
jgi:hypothetical protein